MTPLLSGGPSRGLEGLGGSSELEGSRAPGVWEAEAGAAEGAGKRSGKARPKGEAVCAADRLGKLGCGGTRETEGAAERGRVRQSLECGWRWRRTLSAQDVRWGVWPVNHTAAPSPTPEHDSPTPFSLLLGYWFAASSGLRSPPQTSPPCARPFQLDPASSLLCTLPPLVTDAGAPAPLVLLLCR